MGETRSTAIFPFKEHQFAQQGQAMNRFDEGEIIGRRPRFAALPCLLEQIAKEIDFFPSL
jgi:hypothetical protein